MLVLLTAYYSALYVQIQTGCKSHEFRCRCKKKKKDVNSCADLHTLN